MQKYNFNTISDMCVKCGKCKPNCTIFKISGDEVRSPRGFLDLLGAYNRGELELDKNAKDIFESCFLCTNCVSECPNSLATDTMIENVRRDIADKFGIAWFKRAFFWLLRHRKIMDMAASMGYVFQSCGFKVANGEMKPRFSIPMMKKERLLPTASKKSFMNSHPEFIDNGGSKTVGIFIGCMGNYAYTSIGEGLLKICKAVKLNAHLMKEQSCCAAPAYFTGDFATVEVLAKKNIAYFEEMLTSVDAIIVPEATCSGMLKVDYEHFFANDKQWQERAKNVAKRIFLATQYFEKETNLGEILARIGANLDKQTITYHDPCHAKKMQGVWKEPRALLSKIYNIKEMSDNVSCCGFGGVTMQSEKYHLSRAAGVSRASSIIATEASSVSAECSACKMQLNNALHLKASDMRCLNPIELIAKVL
ncbi:anaerobic glycerol-3-phosphate dehydrogenase [Campylobacter iguaniorum]|uniref:Glycolate oxidase iron-sulfur subunit n=1 Tax=Campylobacter iguaniorum TaxID=1244531 RepID=A0A076FHT5_9BACT|nr:(Fe-S)-binding protein [Campylobacter iguaniorum]AII15344.1 anaerobic glycerol-3-phosphate dehydrogenase [Campylobacter iguaniorum]